MTAVMMMTAVMTVSFPVMNYTHSPVMTVMTPGMMVSGRVMTAGMMMPAVMTGTPVMTVVMTMMTAVMTVLTGTPVQTVMITTLTDVMTVLTVRSLRRARAQAHTRRPG
ncbi:hypothetical protein T484DRAFT_1849586 [Baffinella frigidus]|nr:hypothetical protein T484DRAFT_1849586 [Cryptophyta sp. CCMP2293]